MFWANSVSPSHVVAFEAGAMAVGVLLAVCLLSQRRRRRAFQWPAAQPES